MRAVVHELERLRLIVLQKDACSPEGFAAIGPDQEFFARTDAIFQPWDPQADGQELCRLSRATRNFDAAECDKELGWGPRRLNSAAVEAHSRGWFRVPYEMAHNPTYVLPWAFLTPEGEFFAE